MSKASAVSSNIRQRGDGYLFLVGSREVAEHPESIVARVNMSVEMHHLLIKEGPVPLVLYDNFLSKAVSIMCCGG